MDAPTCPDLTRITREVQFDRLDRRNHLTRPKIQARAAWSCQGWPRQAKVMHPCHPVSPCDPGVGPAPLFKHCLLQSLCEASSPRPLLLLLRAPPFAQAPISDTTRTMHLLYESQSQKVRRAPGSAHVALSCAGHEKSWCKLTLLKPPKGSEGTASVGRSPTLAEVEPATARI